MPKNWCFWTMVLEKTLGIPSDCKEIQPVHPRGNQSWIFIGRTSAEAETSILWPPDAKNWLTGKDPDAGKNWRQEEKGATEDEMVGWYHRLDGHGFGWTPGVGDGQGGLACCGFMWLQRIRHDWATSLSLSLSITYRRIDAFELWCWRRLLRVPWTARRSNQSILKKISPEYSLEGLML